jgi:hypothetical protein
MKRACLKTLVTIVSVLLLPSLASAETFNDWLNGQVLELAKATRDKTNSETKQAETPSANENSTSLVDQSSAADLISVAANQAGLSIGDEAADSTSASATIFSLYAAFRGVDPLEPNFYNKHANLRRVSLNMGFDEEGEGDDKTTTRLYGFKWKILDYRQPTQTEIGSLSTAINDAGFSRGLMEAKIRAYLFTKVASMRKIIENEYRSFLSNPAARTGIACKPEEIDEAQRDSVVARLLTRRFDEQGRPTEWTECELGYRSKWVEGPAGASFDFSDFTAHDLAGIQEVIKAELGSFEALTEMTDRLLKRVRTAPQFSLAASYKDLPEGGHSYLGEAIYDHGLADRWTLTLNGTFERTRSEATQEDPAIAALEENDKDSWKIAGQLRYKLTAETLTRKSAYLDLAGERSKKDDEETIYKIQAKTAIPLTGGITIPFSVTYASSADLIEEDDVRGQVGFSIDISKLVESLR